MRHNIGFWREIWRGLRLLPLFLLLLSQATLAQSNPAVAACGFPAQGAIVLSATYTLTSDCAQTGSILIASADPGITVTINGGGHTITLPTGTRGFVGSTNSVVNLNSVTIDGAGANNAQGLRVKTLNANQVSFIRGNGGIMLSGDNVSLTNVLLESNTWSVYLLGGNGSAMIVGTGLSTTLNNVIFRNNFGTGGAVLVRTGGSLTATGCLTLSGNVPNDIYVASGGTWTNNSAGPCSGTIGNGHQAAIPAPALMACGLPASGNWDASGTYTLTGDCAWSGRTTISENVDITINGSGHQISAVPGIAIATAATSSVTMNNVALSTARVFNWGDFRAAGFKLSNTSDGFINFGEARFSNALFEDNSTGLSNSRSLLLAWNRYENGFASFTDAVFRNNSGGLGTLQNVGAIIELKGCITFENNMPDTFSGTITDNRSDACGDGIGPRSPSTPSGPSQPRSPERESRVREMVDCFQYLGAIGLICRPGGEPPTLEVWEISPASEGRLLFAVTQSQVEALTVGLVACSADGRAALSVGLQGEVRQIFEKDPNYEEQLLVPRRYIVVSMGPTDEGKVHHVVLSNALYGRVFGTVDTYEGPPAAECAVPSAPAAQPVANLRPFPVKTQPAQPDGSLVHVVQHGDTVGMMAIAYRVPAAEIIARNQLGDGGSLVFPGQRLVIREARN